MARALSTLLVVLAVGLTACGSSTSSNTNTNTNPGPAASGPGHGKPPVLLGTKDFTEEYVLGQLYMQALEAKGFRVVLKNSIGPTEVTDKALTSRKIDMYPEYTGTIVSEVEKSAKLPGSAQDAYSQAKSFEESRGFTLLDMTPFTDRNAVAVKPAFAQKFGLGSMDDLARAGRARYGAPPENKIRFNGLVGMRRVYGLTNLRFIPLPIGKQYKALDSGMIDAAAVFTTDGNLQTGSYVVLSDPKGVFGFQNAAPVVSQKLLTREGPAFAATLNAVSAKLTTLTMQRLNAAVDLGGQTAPNVARQFLRANGLL